MTLSPPSDMARGLLSPLYTNLEDHGFKVMSERQRAGKHTAKQFSEFLKERISMELSYAKSMSNLTKLLGDEDLGSTADAFSALRLETEGLAKGHADFAAFLRAQVEKPLNDLIAEHKMTREHHLALTERNMRHRTNCLQQFSRTKEKCTAKRAETQALRDASKSKYGKDQEKAAQRLSKAETALAQLEQDLRTAEDNLNEANTNWEQEWLKSLDVLGHLELARIESFKSNLNDFLQAARDISVRDAEVYERMRAKADTVSGVGDLSTFMARFSFASGPRPDARQGSFGRLDATLPGDGGAPLVGGGVAPSGFTMTTTVSPQSAYMDSTVPSTSDPSPTNTRNYGTPAAPQLELPRTSLDVGLAGSLQPVLDAMVDPQPPPAYAAPAGTASMPEPALITATPAVSAMTTLPDTVTGGGGYGVSAPQGLGASYDNLPSEQDGGVPSDIMDPNVPAPIECFVVAKFDYNAAISEELSFVAGTELPVLIRHPDGWWLAETNQDPRFPGQRRRGLIPSNFVQAK